MRGHFQMQEKVKSILKMRDENGLPSMAAVAHPFH